MADTPFGGFLQGYLQGKELQAQRARQIAEDMFRQKQLDLSTQELNQRKNEAVIRAKQQDTEQQLSQDKFDWQTAMDLQKQSEDAYQFDTNQKRYAEDRQSREELARIKAESAKQIAEMRNLSMDDRFRLTEALKNADTPAAATNIFNWLKSMSGGSPASAPTAAPAVPSPMAPVTPSPGGNPAGQPMDVMSLLQSVAGVPQSAPAPGGLDMTQPFGGSNGAQIRSRNAYADKAVADTIAKQTQNEYLGQKYLLESLKAKADISHKQALTKQIEALTPGKAKLLETQIKNLNSQINNRAQEMALKERKAGNTQWEYNYSKATTPEEKQRLVSSNLSGIRTKMQNAGSALSALDKQVNAITIEAARLIEDKKDGLPSKVQNGQISGSNREMYLNNLLDQLPDLKARREAARINYGYYTGILKETGNLTIPKQQTSANPPAVVGQPKAGAKGLAPVAVPTGARPNDAAQRVPKLQMGKVGDQTTKKTDYSKMSDAEIKRALARKLLGK